MKRQVKWYCNRFELMKMDTDIIGGSNVEQDKQCIEVR